MLFPLLVKWNRRWFEAPSCAVHQNGSLRPARAHSTYINVYYTYIFPRLVAMSLYPNISTWGLPLHGNLQAFASYGGFVTQDVDSLAKQRVQGMRHKRISPLETRDFPDRRGGQPGLIGSPSPHHVYNEAVESVDAPENMDDMLPADPVFLVILSLVKPPELTPGYRFWTMLLWFWDGTFSSRKDRLICSRAASS